MRLLERRIDGETPELREQGRADALSRPARGAAVGADCCGKMEWAESETAAGERMTFYVALNYGGRAEILDAAAAFTGGGEEEFRRHLYAPEMHDPDLIIRTQR